jgi:two-component system, OmpR family, phosphate regulon sensor histidine kinase PhoR
VTVFPWRLFAKFILGQLAVMSGVLLVTGAPPLSLLAAGLCFLAFSTWMARRILLPFGRILARVRADGGAGWGAEPAAGGLADGLPGELHEESPSEWGELETALNRIRADLKFKTDLLNQERGELATMMSALSEAILAVDADGAPLFFNSRFVLLFGGPEFPQRRLRLGEVFRDPALLDAFHATVREGQAREVSAPLHPQNESAPRFFSVAVAPLRRPAGGVYGAVGVFHDVTTLKQAERIRIDFVANVSHELRTPMTAIKGYTDTLREDVARGQFDAAPRHLEVITRNVDRLMALVNDLLDLSSIENDARGSLERMEASTQDITDRVLAQVEPLRARFNQGIQLELKAPTVYADPGRAEQVLRNLLENALRYGPAGGQVRVCWEEDSGGVLLRVADRGPGIPLEHQPRLFERFYRVDRARSRELGGTGLGLAIVKHIMQRHGGTVTLRSQPGQGAEFTCEFPGESRQ